MNRQKLWWSGVVGLFVFSLALVDGAQSLTATPAPKCQVWVTSNLGSTEMTVVDSWT